MAASLSVRPFSVNKFNTHLSLSSSVTSGIIQSRVFGPILFILYINDLLVMCKDIKFKLFADDTKSYKTIKHQSNRVVLQHSLYTLCEWSAKWKLSLPLEKFIYN